MKIETVEFPCGCRAEPKYRRMPNTYTVGRLVGWEPHYCPLHAAAGKLLAACKGAAASLALCQLPRRSEHVASNETIIQTALDSFHYVIALAEPKPEATEAVTPEAGA